MFHRTLFVASVVASILTLSFASRAQEDEPERFSLSMFHFNVQYVAGGTRGWPDGVQETPELDLDDAGVQDQIIRETFLPVLELYAEHPDWRVTLEMQGYMAEVMMERHSDVLDLLRELVEAGQVELVSFHYSDQLFLAYPRLDMERSHDLMEEVWEAAELTPSAVVFCQEGQFGVGIASLARARGRTILGLPKNLFKYQHEEDYDSSPPLFELDGSTVVLVGHGITTPEVEVRWNFFDDGELLASGGADPYVGTGMQHDPEAVAEYEAELLNDVSRGYRIATITEFVEWALENGIEQAPLPPMLDGTWQPRSTDSMRRWMGAPGALDFVLHECERDNDVITNNIRARHHILTAETLASHAESAGFIDSGHFDETISGCWRDVLLAQVTDASGITPFVNEVRYGLDHGAAAYDCADAVIDEILPHLEADVVEVDNESGEVALLDAPTTDEPVQAEPFLDEGDGFTVDAPGRDVEVSWFDVGDSGNVHRVEITFQPPEDGERTIEVAFPMSLDAFVLSLGLIEDRIAMLPFDEFDLEEGRISVPAGGGGLVGLDEELWLIKQTDEVHVAATFREGEPFVYFIDETVPSTEGDRWVFWILEGDEDEAIALSRRLNVAPVETFDFRTDEPAQGCDCRASIRRGSTAAALRELLGLGSL